MDKIYATIPTMPSRLPYLEKAVASLLPQVDELFVYFNHFHMVRYPKFLDQVTLLVGPDLGSAGRFFKADQVDGYFATCDDDLEYPKGYINTLIHKVDEYGKKAVITFHGRIMDPPLVSYRGNGPGRTLECLACLKSVMFDKEVMIAGTGVMMYHTSALKVRVQDFKERNMDDTEFSVMANAAGVPIIVAAHKEGWIKYLDPPTHDTIWFTNQSPDQEKKLVDQVNGHKWRFPMLKEAAK